ncbi:hypothetical protein FOA52_006237 [Chlamydomonas sp. UWO 241]|nr:hypothetical protein FOA52_006237 [Chlamydomonas sp. UWO 241]
MVSWPRFGIIQPTQGTWFEKQCRNAFESVDSDKDAALDKQELYIALLKMYDSLNSSLPCHMTIPQEAEVESLMATFDTDKCGKLQYAEFLKLCQALCGTKNHWRKSIPLRVICGVALKMAVFPLAGWALKKGVHSVGVPSKFVPAGLTVLAAESVYKAAGGGII